MPVFKCCSHSELTSDFRFISFGEIAADHPRQVTSVRVFVYASGEQVFVLKHERLGDLHLFHLRFITRMGFLSGCVRTWGRLAEYQRCWFQGFWGIPGCVPHRRMDEEVGCGHRSVTPGNRRNKNGESRRADRRTARSHCILAGSYTGQCGDRLLAVLRVCSFCAPRRTTPILQSDACDGRNTLLARWLCAPSTH